MSNEIAINNEGVNFAQALTYANEGTFSSMSLATPADKARFYNATTNPEYRTSDFINKCIVIKDVICEGVEVTNRKGEKSVAPRVILIDKEGHSYASVSTGIFSAIRRMITIFGPPTWDDGIVVEVKQIKKGENNILTLEIGEF